MEPKRRSTYSALAAWYTVDCYACLPLAIWIALMIMIRSGISAVYVWPSIYRILQNAIEDYATKLLA